jgi:sugar/nucleoside kinase (ribokinase family)
LSFEVCVFGTICLDKFCRIPRLPEPGGYVESEYEAAFLGGEAANTAVALKLWGESVQLQGNAAGKDEDGDLLDRLLAEEGFGGLKRREGVRTPVCDIFVTPDGERTMIGRGFSQLADESFSVGECSGWFTVDPNFGEASRKAAVQAQSAGLSVYLMDFFQPSDASVVRGCRVWQSSTDWVGRKGDRVANLDWVAQHTVRHGCVTIVTDGAQGVYVCEPGTEACFRPALPVGPIVDATGAGDVFRAGMLLGLCRGWPLCESLLFAAAAGALNCLALGGNTQIPTMEAVRALIERCPEEAAMYA